MWRASYDAYAMPRKIASRITRAAACVAEAGLTGTTACSPSWPCGLKLLARSRSTFSTQGALLGAHIGYGQGLSQASAPNPSYPPIVLMMFAYGPRPHPQRNLNSVFQRRKIINKSKPKQNQSGAILEYRSFLRFCQHFRHFSSLHWCTMVA